MKTFYKNKIILVTGGCGSIGSEIVRTLLNFKPREIIILDTNEEGVFNLKQEFNKNSNIKFLIGSITDKERVKFAIKNVHIVFHTAAIKHVPICEFNPFEAVKTNIIGTQNLIECARDEGVDNFVAISTDKAVNPIGTMGATKLLSEKLVLSVDNINSKTLFSCVRFGNVLKSSGSVIPLFEKQILNGGPVTITSENMTRFFMSIPQGVNLVLQSAVLSQGHDTFILKMPALKIIDLAKVLIKKYNKDIDIQIIGKRIGEKTHEVLITNDEAEYVVELKEMYVLRNNTQRHKNLSSEYNSNSVKLLAEKEILQLLK